MIGGLLLAVALAGSAAAEPALGAVRWELIPAKRGAAAESITALPDASPKLGGRLRARLILKNRGPKRVESLLLRYSLSAKIEPKAGGRDAVWTVPFAVEEKRVALLKPNQVTEVPLGPSAMLGLYLKKLQREGYKPVELKLQVMLEPRLGADWGPEPIEASLPVGAPAP